MEEIKRLAQLKKASHAVEGIVMLWLMLRENVTFCEKGNKQ